jgi:hypothetical protein
LKRFPVPETGMKTFLIALLLAVPALALARDPCHEKTTPECVARQKQQCGKAIEMGLAQARDLPARGAAEIERKQELVKKLEKLVADRRREGADECRTWTEVMGIAFTQ